MPIDPNKIYTTLDPSFSLKMGEENLLLIVFQTYFFDFYFFHSNFFYALTCNLFSAYHMFYCIKKMHPFNFQVLI